MSIEAVLAELGLQKNKGVVYLACLATGPATTADIANQAKLPRTTTHEILQQLVSMGLISFVTKGRTRIYTAEAPKKLRTLIKEKERKLEKILPQLDLLTNVVGDKPTVKFYEGVEGVKTVFEDTLHVENKVLRGILSMHDLYETPGKNYMDDYVTRRVGAGIKLQVIRSVSKEVEETWPASTEENRELHYAPEDMVFPMTMYLYDDKVGLIGTKQENFGMIIESKDFFKTQSNLFEAFWQITRVAKKVD